MVSIIPHCVTYRTFRDSSDARILFAIAAFFFPLENCGLSISGCNSTGFISMGGEGRVERICTKIGYTHYKDRNSVFRRVFQALLKKRFTDFLRTLGKV
jgi:hypothetical protein